MAYDRQGNWVAEDVQSPFGRSDNSNPNGGFMVGNNGLSSGIAASQRRASGVQDYNIDKLQQGVNSANAESAIAEAQYGLDNPRKVDRDNDIRGSAARINKGADPAIYSAGGLKGKQIVNTYDPDRPASMDNPANNPWQDMARQLATFSALRSFDQKMHPEWYPEQNSEAMQIERLRGENQLSSVGMQGQNQREVTGMQGRNQLEVEGLRGRNQESHDWRTYGQALDVEALRQRNPYYASAARENEAKSRLYGVQADQAEREAIYGKLPQAQYMKQLELLGKGAQAGDPVATQMYQEALARLAFFNKKNGYAEGGKVDPEELMRQMSAKYGAPTAPQPAPQPVQQPRPVQQPQPQQQGGLMDRMRAAATGNLDQRMRAAGAYAEGGPVGVGGRQVLGEGDGKSDSLPAVIDGEHPAALSTGEFVMPIEAVQHFGLAKLNKMVEQARKGLDTGR